MDNYQEEQEQEGLTLGEMFRVIFKHVKLFCIISVVTAAVLVLGILFVLNPARTSYTMEFNLTFPGMGSGRYPDGTAYRFSDMFSYDTLQTVKNSDEKFSKIDVKEMTEKDAIKIVIPAEKEEADKEIRSYYKVTVDGKYFSDKETATDFLHAVVEYPVNYAKSKATMVQNSNLKAYQQASTYDEKLSFLSAQKNYLASRYDSFASQYGENFTVDGKSLVDYEIALDSVYPSFMASNLASELKYKGYMTDTELQAAELRKSVLLREQTKNQELIDSLLKLMNDQEGGTPELAQTEAISQQIVSLTSRNANINIELEAIERNQAKADNIVEECKEFVEKIDKIYADLTAQTEIFKTVNNAVYQTESVAFYKTNMVVADGSLGLIMTLLLSVVLAVILGLLIVGVIYIPKYSREKRGIAEAATKSQEEPTAEVESPKEKRSGGSAIDVDTVPAEQK